jgi:hypothetical protein
MQTIPLQSVPSQQVKTVLGGQNCQISIYSKEQGVFADINVNGADVSTGILALNAVPLCPFDYTGLSGNLMFVDTQGTSDPTYAGIGVRFQLVYLSEAEYANL